MLIFILIYECCQLAPVPKPEPVPEPELVPEPEPVPEPASEVIIELIDEAVQSPGVAGPSRNVINVNNPDFDATVSDWIDRLETLDSDDEDLNDIDDLVDGIPFITAAPRTVREQIADDTGLTLTETEILRLEEETSDRHVRELVSSNDYFEFNWSEDRGTFTGEREVFTGVPGPTFPITDATRPVDIFYKMFDNDFIDMMVTETNRYAEQRVSVARQDATKKSARPLRWRPTDRDEMLAFFTLMILQGLYPKVREEAYFSFDGFGTTPYFGRIMSYNRYHLLKAFQHFIDNDTTTDLTKLNKIRPVLDYLNDKFASLYKPAQEIAIDESLLKWHGRLSFSQKISSKAAQVGVKTYELCESSTGYPWRFFVCTGKDGPNRTDRTGQDRADRTDLTTVRTTQTMTAPTTAVTKFVRATLLPKLFTT
ncbi:hypothetical protein evm_010900 [Chilo suppressalis]|nr:hypothetical protein evm_010900 [Chilo suppressalis]